MSLNWKEIDAILGELDIIGAQVQRIIQPAWDTVLLSLYKPGKATELLFCVAHGACRLHETDLAIPKTLKPQRFTELLRAHIRGSRIERIEQLGAERIVRLSLTHESGNCYLYARLWSGAANLILTRTDGTIIDALARKPARGELSGGVYVPQVAASLPSKSFSIRDLPGSGSFNQRIDRFYAAHGSELSREALLARALAWLGDKQAILSSRLQALNDRAQAYADPDRFRELGDILMANLHREAELQVARQAKKLDKIRLDCDDFYRGGQVSIVVDTNKKLLESANALYEKAKKARSGSRETASELAGVRQSLDELEKLRQQVQSETNPHKIRAALQKWHQSRQQTERRFPGLSLEKDGWTLLVGRSSAENDALLRQHVRGNDTWLHVRDFAGSYVFIKSRRDKTIPLDILLDAASLALYYSKARKNGQADLYYTQVKYLRRAKHGPKGLVIPTQEKNLHVKLEDTRLRNLRRLIGQDDNA